MINNDDVIELVDEEGNETKFGYEDTILLNGKEYVILVPLDKSSSSSDDESDDEYEEVVIMRIEENEAGEECLVTIDSDEEEDMVFSEFCRKCEEDDVEE